MRKILIPPVVLFLTTSALAEDFTIATFNAEFLVMERVHVKYGLSFNMSDNSKSEQDEWDPAEFRTQRFKQAVDRVAKMIAGIETDVLVLTEVDDGLELKLLVDAIAENGTTYPHFEVCDCNDRSTGQHVAILSKRPFIDSKTMLSLPGRAAFDAEVDDPDEQRDTGISKGMRVAVNVENNAGDMVPVYIFGLHLVSERGGFDIDQQRIAQATIARRHAVELLNRGEHVIVVGDLNDRRGQPTLRRLRGMDDIWPDLIQTGHWSYFEPEQEASRWTYQFRGQLIQIDHILLSYSLRKNQDDAVSTSVMDVPQDENPSISDHRPVIVSLEMP